MIKLPFLGLDEIKEDPKGFGKALFAEFLGTALLVRSKKENAKYTFVDTYLYVLPLQQCVATNLPTLGLIVHFSPERCSLGAEAAWAAIKAKMTSK